MLIRIGYEIPTAPSPRRSRVIALRKDYQDEYFLILDNGLNQLAHGHFL